MQKNTEVIPATEVQESKTRIEALREEMSATKVSSKEDLQVVATNIAKVKESKKRVTAERDKYIAPAKEIIAHAKALFDPLIDMCDEVESVLKGKAEEYMLAEEKRIEDAKAKEIGKVESGYQKPETAVKKMEQIGDADKKVETEGSTLTLKKVKDIEIVDEQAIPDEYYKPRELDMVKIKKVALAGVVIPGVKVVEKSQMASRAK